MDEDFRQQVKGNLDENNPVLASKFTKISTLLHLISPSPNQFENNSISAKIPSTRTDDINENSSKSLLNSSDLCCTHHFQNSQLAMIPISRSISYQSAHFFRSESLSKRNSKLNSRRYSSNYSDQIIVNIINQKYFSNKIFIQ
jgi:hypothetical protein